MRRKMIVVAAVAAVYVLLAGGLALASPRATAVDAPDATRGSQVYKSNCAACHGPQGEGRLGIPNLAGAAGHVQRLGIPADQAGPGIVELLRSGIAGNMPAFPPTVLSDEAIADLGAYLFTLPATTGANLYTANCALCHGLNAEGSVGPALTGAAERFVGLNRVKLEVLKTFPDLVRKGISGRMPGSPQLADVEISRLGDYLWGLGSWETEFEKAQGHAPGIRDRADRQWSLQFAATAGRGPTDQDWRAHFAESLSSTQATTLDVRVGMPPAGGWKWVVMRRSTGSDDVDEISENPNEHGNDWVFHVLRGTKEMATPGGTVKLGVGETGLLPARGAHSHRFGAQSEILGFRVHAATGRAPDNYHRGTPLLFSEQALDTAPGTSYRLRVREFTVAAGQRIHGTIEAGPSFAYVVEGTLALPGATTGTTATGNLLSLPATRSLAVSNAGATPLRLVLVDLH